MTGPVILILASIYVLYMFFHELGYIAGYEDGLKDSENEDKE